MIQFFRNILGLGPAELSNTIKKKLPTTSKRAIDKSDSLEDMFKDHDILPAFFTLNTKDFFLNENVVVVFHEREEIFAQILILYVLVEKQDESNISQISTTEENEYVFDIFSDKALENLDKLVIPFEFWTSNDLKYNFKILSTGMSFFASQKIMSKKHMLEAHRILDCKELLVSIPRRGLIFVCNSDLTDEDQKAFFELHSYLILMENSDLELLSEDIFVVEDGEITSCHYFNQLSEILNKNKTSE